MRKMRIRDGEFGQLAAEWLDLEKIAIAEISSEDELFPIEHALGKTVSTGWRARETGPQVIRLRFDDPVELHTIEVHVVERAAERTQEMAIYVEMEGMGVQEVVRQQFTFSPHGSTEEIEEFAVELKGVTMLELRIDPDRAHVAGQSQNYASLAWLRLG
jgi:hypothetical protein